MKAVIRWETYPNGRRRPRLWLDGVEIPGIVELVVRDHVGEWPRITLELQPRSLTTVETETNHP